MPERKPDKREQRRIDKRNREEESRRAKVILELSRGKSLREAGRAVGRCHEYARYWRDEAMEKVGYRITNGVKKDVYRPVKGWKDRIKVKRPGPPKGRFVKRSAFREEVIELKKRYPRIGCAKLVIIGKLEISGPTVCGILKEEGMIRPRKTGRKVKRFRAAAPNDMWQIDYLDLGHRQHLLSVMDDCTGKILSDDVRGTMLADDAVEIVKECIRTYGPPKAILSDHGVQWYSMRGGETKFDKMCEEFGIDHIMGRIRHPQTQGKVERFHRSIKDETEIKNISDPFEKKKALAEYVHFYNTVRPHWGIGLRTPNSVYFSIVPG